MPASAIFEDYETGTSGNNVTTALSAFATVPGAEFKWSNTHAHNGSLSGHFSVTSSTAAAVMTLGISRNTNWGQRYLWFDAYPAVDTVIWTAWSGTTNVARLLLSATGKLVVKDSTTTVSTSSTSVATGQWVRVAWQVTPQTTSGASSQVVRLYQGSKLELAAGTYTEQVTGTCYRAGMTSVTEYRSGVISPSSTFDYYDDDYEPEGGATEPGPTGSSGGGDLILDWSSASASAAWSAGTLLYESVYPMPSMSSFGAMSEWDLQIVPGGAGLTFDWQSLSAFASMSDAWGLVAPTEAEQYPAAMVEPRVDIAFTSWAGEPLWTDVTRWVDATAGISITRGRSSETELPDTGSMSLVLDNRDGRYTPGYQGSPHYPNVTLGRPVRCQVVTTAKNWAIDPQFTTGVGAWSADWSGLGYTAAESITRTDATGTGGIAAARAKLADVATAAFNVVVFGDSVSEGMDATAVGNRWVDKLQAALRAAYPVAGVDEVEQTYVPAWYGQAGYGLDWSSPTLGGTATILEDYGLGARSVELDASGESVTFSVTGKTVQVHYLKSDFLAGHFTVTIDGGAPTNIDSYDAGAAGGVAATWTSGTLTDTAHTVVCAWASGSTSWILGCKPFDDDSGKSIHVWDAGHGGYTADLHDGKNLTQVASVGADLAVIALGFNDAGGTYSPSLFATKLTSLMTALRAQVANLPVLLVGYYNPRAAEAGWLYPDWSQYIAAMADVASADAYAEFLDLSTVMPDTWEDPGYYADNVHPNDVGHAYIASKVTAAVSVPEGTAGLVTWADATEPTAAGVNVYALRRGQQYTASASVLVPTGSPDVRLDVPFIATGSATSTKDDWTTISVTFVAEATFHLLALVADTSDAGDTCLITDVQVELGSSVTSLDADGATVLDRFRGTVTAWPMTWPGSVATYAESRLAASDGLRRLGSMGELRSMLEEEHRYAGPVAYWPMEDPSGATTAGAVDPYSTRPLTPTRRSTGGTYEFGTDLLPAAGVTGVTLVPELAGTSGYFLTGSVRPGSWTDGSALSWSAGVMFTGTNASRTLLVLPAPDGYMLVGTNASSKVFVSQVIDGTAVWTTTAADAHDSGLHHVMVTSERSSVFDTLVLYVDGVAQSPTTVYGGTGLNLSAAVGVGGATTLDLWSGRLGHVAVFGRALTSAEVSRLAGCVTGWDGDTTDERVNRVADWLGLTSDERDVGASGSTLSTQPTKGQTALAVLQDAERAENGVLVWSRSGALQHRGRATRWNAVVDFTVDAANLAAPPVFALDDVMLAAAGNDVTVTRPGGAAQRVVNQASVDAYGLYRQSLDVPLADDEQSRDAARWRAQTYGVPAVRCTQVQVDLVTTPGETLRGAFLAADIGTRLQVVGLPGGAPADTVDLFVEGYQETIGVDRWPIEWTTSPAGAWPVWTIEDPVLGRIDSVARIAY